MLFRVNTGHQMRLWNMAEALANTTNSDTGEVEIDPQLLWRYCHSPESRNLWALSGNILRFVQRRINVHQFLSHRPSYVNAILINTRGQPARSICSACANPKIGLTPFPVCMTVRGHFQGACGNCKWRDHGARCFLGDNPRRSPSKRSDDDDEDEDSPPPPSRKRKPSSSDKKRGQGARERETFPWLWKT